MNFTGWVPPEVKIGLVVIVVMLGVIIFMAWRLAP